MVPAMSESEKSRRVRAPAAQGKGKPGGTARAGAPVLNARGTKHRSNRSWIVRHVTDPYVQAATRQGYRSRAAFKLLEIDERERLFRPGSVIVDLGSAPGSWSQVAVERLTRGGKSDSGLNGVVIALDILPMEPIPGVQFILGDFREESVMDELARVLDGRRVDLVLSDMSPNLSGIGVADAVRSAHLWELALAFAVEHLKPDGRLLTKTFHGSGHSQFVEQLKRHFSRVVERKPPASRQESAETYLLAGKLKGTAAVKA